MGILHSFLATATKTYPRRYTQLMIQRKNILLILLILIIAVYSSEINFMPNYVQKPDKWHLLMPMFIFYSSIFIQLIWNVIVMIRNKKIEWDYSVLTIVSLYCFAILNNSKGNWQEIGYLGIILIIIILTSLNVRFYKKKKRE